MALGTEVKSADLALHRRKWLLGDSRSLGWKEVLHPRKATLIGKWLAFHRGQKGLSLENFEKCS